MSSTNCQKTQALMDYLRIDFSDIREKIEQAEFEKQMKDDKPEQEDLK